jgi:diacylglycerol O-acyltransferase / wax synthase
VIGKDFVVNLLDAMPAPLSELMQRFTRMPSLGLVVSSVRGPEEALFLAGARMVAHLPISTIMDGMALNCTGFSYNGTLWVCALSCRDILPDPAFFVECLSSSFAALKQAAADLRTTHEGPDAKATPRHLAKKRAAPSRPRKRTSNGKSREVRLAH